MDIDLSNEPNARVANFAFQFAQEATKYKKLAEDAKAELRRRLAVSREPHAFGKIRVKVAEYRRFDAGLAEEVLPATKFKKICVAKPDATLAKAVLTKAEYEQTRKKYENAVTITVEE